MTTRRRAALALGAVLLTAAVLEQPPSEGQDRTGDNHDGTEFYEDNQPGTPELQPPAMETIPASPVPTAVHAQPTQTG